MDEGLDLRREFSGGNRENQFVEQGRPVLYACTGCAANRSIDPDNGVPVGGIVKLTHHKLRQPQDIVSKTTSEYSMGWLGPSVAT